MFSFIENIVAKILNIFIFWVSSFLDNLYLTQYTPLQIILDITLISVIFYFIIKFIKGTRSFQILIGLFILGIIYSLSRALELTALNTILSYFFTMIIVAIPIVFQQELRRGLERIGQTKLFRLKKEHITKDEATSICDTTKSLVKKKYGALIVIEGKTILQEFIETGIALNSNINKEILISIFTPPSPLHDGAVIIRKNKIIAASAVLPFSSNIEDFSAGTRHKAAKGLADSTDAFVIVVSEEKREISVAHEGNFFKNISYNKLRSLLSDFLKNQQ